MSRIIVDGVSMDFHAEDPLSTIDFTHTTVAASVATFGTTSEGNRVLGICHTAGDGYVYVLVRPVGGADAPSSTQYMRALAVGDSVEFLVDKNMEIAYVGQDATSRNVTLWEAR